MSNLIAINRGTLAQEIEHTLNCTQQKQVIRIMITYYLW